MTISKVLQIVHLLILAGSVIWLIVGGYYFFKALIKYSYHRWFYRGPITIIYRDENETTQTWTSSGSSYCPAGKKSEN